MTRARNTADQINRVNSSAANATAITIDSSENVLVGHTSAFSPISNGGSGVTATAAGQLFAGHAGTPLYVNREDSDGDIAVFRKDGTAVGSIGSVDGDIYVGTGDTGLFFSDANNQIRPYDTSTQNSVDATIDLGRTTSRFKDLYLSGGAFIGGTGSANKLDDYEEGTFEVTGTLTGGSVTLNSSYNTMSYTKVGRKVTICGLVITSAVSNPSGVRVRLENLPFTSANLSEGSGASGGGFSYWDGSNIHAKSWLISEGATTMALYLDCSSLTAGKDFYISATYFTYP